jgi:5-deoxy-glucuronate isomerase
MARIYRAEGDGPYCPVITDSNAGDMQFCRFGLVTLAAGESWSGQFEDMETVLVVLTGTVEVEAGGEHWSGLGARSSVFDGKATAVYAGPVTALRVAALAGPAEIGVCGVRSDARHAPFVVTPEDVVVHHRGRDSWRRDVHDIVGDNGEGRVERIVVGETFGHAGGWSSYPPHKHDETSAEQTQLEEIYHYRFNPASGFGVQLLYATDGDVDEAHIVRSGDSFAISRGYHPVVAAGGYEIYYLWFLGGPHGRQLRPFDDPAHRWLHRTAV